MTAGCASGRRDVAEPCGRGSSRAGESAWRSTVAASQVEFLDALASAPAIDWAKAEAFQHRSTSACRWATPAPSGGGLTTTSGRGSGPAGWSGWTAARRTQQAECRRYGSLVTDGGIDLALLGIGENGHLAFNDPGVADFADPLAAKVIALDEIALGQQVRDGAFPSLDLVPRRAITLTMSTILGSRAIAVVVPGAQKAPAVRAALDGPIGTACPASALRTHPDAVLFLDEAAAGQLAAGDRGA